LEGSLTHLDPSASLEDASVRSLQAFEGRDAPQIAVGLKPFGRWDTFERKGLEGVFRDEKSGRPSLIVAAPRPVAQDRYRVLDALEEDQIFGEAGLDPRAIRARGGRIVRAVDNLIEVEVPEEGLAGL